MNSPTTKPMTRQQMAQHLGICPRTLSRFMKEAKLHIKPRALLRPCEINTIIQKFNDEQRQMSNDVQ